MNNSDREIAEFILSNTEAVTRMSIQELGRATFSSASTIYRMCRSLGFQGFKDFKQSLIYDAAMRSRENKPEKEEIQRADSLEKIVEIVTCNNILSLENTKSLVDLRSLEQCVSLMAEARTVLLFGLGASFSVVRDAYLKFLRINKPCSANEDWHAQLLTARNSGTKDLGIVISNSGETPEMLECIKQMQKNGTPVIAITRTVNSPVAKLADHTLYAAANETQPQNDALFSRISQLNVMDILYAAYVYRYDGSVQLTEAEETADPGAAPGKHGEN